MPGIVLDLPALLNGSASSATATYTPSTIAVDYAVAGLPFLSAINDKFPAYRELAQVRKQQFDNSREPGEQTLTGWWLRSQQSFHLGTGLKFREPQVLSGLGNDNTELALRYFDSLGVDPWTAGQLTLLHKTNLKKAATGTVYVTGALAGTTDVYLHGADAVLTREGDGTSTAITWGGSGTISSLTTDGTNYYVSDATGIYSGAIAAGAGALLWNNSSANVTLAWCKQRLMAGIDNKVYELAGGTPPTLPTAKYTHPNTAWTWTSFAESGSAIFAAGYAGASSAIYRFTLQADGTVPTLSQGTVTARLPLGEQVHSIFCYLGRFLAIGTNKGLRIGLVDDNGNVEYGPLSIVTTTPVKCLAGQDRFVYCGATNYLSGLSGLCRVDLSAELADGRYAYATDLQTKVAGEVTTVANFGSSTRLAIGVSGSGSYLEDPAVLEPSGFMQTANVRFSTLEPKLFKFVRTRADVAKGALGIAAVDSSGVVNSLVSFGGTATGVSPGSVDVSLGYSTSQEYMALRYTLTRDTVDDTAGPKLNGWQIKALPGVPRDEVFTLPLLCFDYEKDRYGQRWGYEGSALDRYTALRDVVATGDLVSFQDLGRNMSRQVIVEEMKFVQSSPPDGNARNFGGVIQLSLRAVL